MTAAPGLWPVRLTSAAEADLQSIIDWTLEQFGDAQASTYAETIALALAALTDGPTASGVRERSDIAKGLFTLHVARNGRRGRHFVMFRVGSEKQHQWMDVLRFLHDAMDLPRHLPTLDDAL
jgi:toxin ParE1/3/4